MKFYWFTKKPTHIYLDHASATPLDRDVAASFASAQQSRFANAGAIHSGGVASKCALDAARKKIATLLHARPREIIFTSGGTESNNLAIVGVIQAFKKFHHNRTPHIVVSTIEHASVLEPIKLMESYGAHVTYVPVDTDGLISISDLKKALTEDTVLVCIMYANNEVGVIEPIREIGKAIEKFRENTKSAYPYFFTDACQATNYELMDVEKLRVDLLTLNSSKIYGPKGIGLLYVKTGVQIEPIISGGGQEFGMRSGTESVPHVEAFAVALEKALSLQEQESARLRALREYFFAEVTTRIPTVKIWGSREYRLPNTINISVPGIFAEEIIIGLDALGIMVSSKSACGMSSDEGSYVILALGGTQQESKESVRITLGRGTTKAHIDATLTGLEHIVSRHATITYLL